MWEYGDMTFPENSAIIAVADATFLNLVKAGITARNHITNVARAVAWEPQGTLREAIGGPDAPAVLTGSGGLAIVGLPADAAARLAPALSVRLVKDVGTATLCGPGRTSSWTIDTPAGPARRWSMADGIVIENTGTPAPEEAGIAQLDEGALLELVRRRTGVELQADSVAIPIDLGELAPLLDPPDWRDTTPAPVQDDIDRLIDHCLGWATALLERNGSVVPFAVAIGTDGQFVPLSSYADTTLPSLDDLLWQSICARRDHYRAIAMTSPITMDGAPALRVWLEHQEGPALQALLPYAKSRFRGTYTYGKLAVFTTEPDVWR